MVQRGLDSAKIRHVRIDGTVNAPARQRTLDQFQSMDDIKVILMTISCGGVGLDVTAASRVHLLEPQWNPAVEDQALARVHRMGQRKPVVTIRYIMRDSIEEVSVLLFSFLHSFLLPKSRLFPLIHALIISVLLS